MIDKSSNQGINGIGEVKIEDNLVNYNRGKYSGFL